MKILKKIFQLPLYVRFVLYSTILFILYYFFYFYLKNLPVVYYFYEEGIHYLSIITLKVANYILHLLGYDTIVYAKIIKIKGAYGVHLDKGCLGRNTILVFAGFIIAYPGNIKSKLWFIPLGILIFFFMNVIRIDALAITDYCCREYLDFNHHKTFKIAIYSAILLMWIFWIKKYGSKK